MCLKAPILHLLHLQLWLILLLCGLSTSTSPKNIVSWVGGSNALQSATGYLWDNSILLWHADGLSGLCVYFLLWLFYIWNMLFNFDVLMHTYVVEELHNVPFVADLDLVVSILIYCFYISSRSWAKHMKCWAILKRKNCMINMVKMPLKKERGEEQEAHFIIHLIFSNHFLVQALVVRLSLFIFMLFSFHF